MNCNCKIKIKDEFKTIMFSPLLNQPINLSKINESQFEFFKDIFPEAFEKICICSINKEYSTIYNKKKKK